MLGFNPFSSGLFGLKSIYVNWETPIRAFGSKAFWGVDTESCTLYVPKGTYDKYQEATGWSRFKNIVEYENKVTVTLSKAGTLPDKIGKIEKYYIDNLKVIGDINGTDLRMIRSMAGCDYEGNRTGRLAKLDLSEANIVSGGDPYYKYSYFDSKDSCSYKDSCYTENNKIGKCAFNLCSQLTSINMPSNITEIDSAAFNFCHSLKSIVIPSSVTKIGAWAFMWCDSLTSINIPESVTKIGVSAFGSCKSRTSINIPTSVTEIGDKAFSGCSSLTSIDIPSSVTKINLATFMYCDSLTSINIPTSVTEIGSKAFSGCSSLTSIDIPTSVTEIGSRAFGYCKSLTSINLPKSITEISDWAFENCSSLTSINIPESVTKIGSDAFYGCSSLTSINIPERVDTIWGLAFSGCSKLQTLSLPSAVKLVGYNNFYDCENLTSVYANSNTPPEIEEPYNQDFFDKCNLAERCTLYVPKGSAEAYSSSNWHLYFNNIKEFDTETGVHVTEASSQPAELSRHDINGRKIEKPAKGLNIIKYSDGSVRKEFAK